MNFPQNIEPGFNFNEAIAMAELSRRAYRVFEYERGRDIEELYNGIYNNAIWQFVHYISDYQTDDRALILKRQENQYAIVFRGTIFTSPGLELTGLDLDTDTQFVQYPAIPGEPIPPSYDSQVYKGMYVGFEAFKDEIEFFFDVLVGCKLEQKLLIDLIKTDQQERGSRISAIGAAVEIRYPKSDKLNFIENMTKEIDNIVYGNINESSFDDIIKKSIGDEDLETYNQEEIEIYVTGHSRGAVLASFTAIHLKRYFLSKKYCYKEYDIKIKMYNQGSTKIGNETFVNYYKNYMDGFSYRVQNILDTGTYFPIGSCGPFPYNLGLLLPGVNYVREGDRYYALYKHVGEVYTVFGLGYQNLNLNFGGALNFTITVPFPHGPDGYKEMLIEAQQRQQKALMTFTNFFNIVFEKQKVAMVDLERKIDDILQILNIEPKHK
jgi:hypothetical protein